MGLSKRGKAAQAEERRRKKSFQDRDQSSTSEAWRPQTAADFADSFLQDYALSEEDGDDHDDESIDGNPGPSSQTPVVEERPISRIFGTTKRGWMC
jgi:hypothetical protein